MGQLGAGVANLGPLCLPGIEISTYSECFSSGEHNQSALVHTQRREQSSK